MLPNFLSCIVLSPPPPPAATAAAQVRRLFLCITVPPRVGCCVLLSTSRIAAPILNRPGRHRFRSRQRLRRRRLIFSSPPPFPSVNQNKKIICIAAPQRVDCCVAVKPNAIVAAPKDEEDNSDLSFPFLLLLLLAQRIYCLYLLHELIVVLRNQTAPSSTYYLIIYRRPWPIVMNGDECRRCKTSLPPPGARGRQDGDCLHS